MHRIWEDTRYQSTKLNELDSLVRQEKLKNKFEIPIEVVNEAKEKFVERIPSPSLSKKSKSHESLKKKKKIKTKLVSPKKSKSSQSASDSEEEEVPRIASPKVHLKPSKKPQRKKEYAKYETDTFHEEMLETTKSIS